MKNKPTATVYVSNLSYKRDRNGLKSIFSRYGKINSIKLIVEPETQQSRGMAFVQMGSVEEATKAIQGLTGAVIDGRNIKANYATVEYVNHRQDREEKDLNYVSKQLAKKARNDKRRAARPAFLQ